MELIRAELMFLKYPTPEDDGDDELDTALTHPPDNIPNSINIGPLPNLVKNE